MVLTVCLLGGCAAEIYYLDSASFHPAPDSAYLGAAVQAAAYLATLLLLVGGLRHGCISSGPLSLFWLGITHQHR